jgi:peroxiredoxin
MKNAFYTLGITLQILLCVTSVASQESQPFVLKGITQNLPNGKVIYIRDIISNTIIDSLAVQENRFTYAKNFEEFPKHIYLHTADYAEMKSFWIEDTIITFDASRSNFEDAKILGSRTQMELNLLLSESRVVESEDQIEAITTKYIVDYPDNRAMAAALAGYASSWGRSKVLSLYNGMSETNKASVYGRQIEQFIRLNKTHEIGDRYSDFEMENEKGELIKLSDNLGKVTLLEFWASWCGPCRKQNPELVKLYRDYHPLGFEIVSISLDFSKEEWEEAIKKDQLSWIHLSDLKGRNNTACMIYGVNAIPDNFLIDQDGVVIGKYLWGDALKEILDEQLNEK